MDMVKQRTQRPNFILSPVQERLLFSALNSNKASKVEFSYPQSSTNPTTMAPMALIESPLQAPGSGTLNGFEESPFVDYDYDFDAENGFDYDFSNDSQGQMIGKLPGSSSDGDADTHDKRSHPDDEDNEDDGGGKRREGEDRSSKKPGRKLLTSEPTSKRKAQNRAAQRAFRERKEKHLKDLETKVEDLEKASESANHENSILRAQIEKMSVELREYRKRLPAAANGRSPPVKGGLPPYLAGKISNKNANNVNNPSDINFQFEFPKFGSLPAPPVLNASSLTGSNSVTSPATSAHRVSNSSSISPFDQPLLHNASFGSISSNHTNSISQDAPLFPLDGSDISDFSGLFTPAPLDQFGKDYSLEQPAHNSTASRSSTDSARGANSTGQSTTYSSPSASSNVGSNAGLSSSCGTSPEPYTQSPGAFKPNENALSTIGEEHPAITSNEGEASFCEKLKMACGSPTNPIPRTMSESGVTSGNFQISGFDKTPGFDINGIDWFAQQNGNQFDPQLFGDYREPQNNILTGGLYDDTFFAEAFALPEFSSNSPFTLAASPAPAKKDLVQEIDQKLNQDEEVVPGEDRTQLLSCNRMWEKIQACPSVQSGNVDMDDLCSQLQSKAKCSGEGPVINEKDFTEIIHKIVKKDKA